MIEMAHVSKTYGPGRQALFDITLKVGKGEFVYLIGPSGAGKTTLLKLLYAAERPTEGEVRVDRFNVGLLKPRRIPALRRSLGIVFQDLKLLSGRTALGNVAFALEVVGSGRKDFHRKASQALRLVGLEREAGVLPSQLSAGERQRVAIARAIANDPVLLIADEPTGNIDRAAIGQIMGIFNEVNLRGTTVVVATNNEGLPEMLPKRRVYMAEGRIWEDPSLEIPGDHPPFDFVVEKKTEGLE
jgi:cell division transport system ATP-binding protein